MTIKYLDYIQYPQWDIMIKWSKLILKTPEQIFELAKIWSDIAIRNDEISAQNTKMHTDALKEIEDVLKKYDIPTRNKHNGYTPQFKALTKHLENRLLWSMPSHPYTTQRTEVVNGCSLSSTHQDNLIDLYNDITFQYKQYLESLKMKDKLYQRCCLYIKQHDEIQIEDIPIDSKDSVINFVRRHIQFGFGDEVEDWQFEEMLPK